MPAVNLIYGTRILFAKLFRKSTEWETAEALYRESVAAARQPVFYRDWGVADDVDGRFDLIVLHVFLMIRRLKDEGPQASTVQQYLQEVLFADMDRSLREMGVGDMSVGKHIKKMANAYFGRLSAYEAALDAGDKIQREKVLQRNIYREQRPDGPALKNLAAYVAGQAAHLNSFALQDILTGTANFKAPDDAATSD